eukprot:scaffold20022_cov112-Isochrysis_galbana.AAC.3
MKACGKQQAKRYFALPSLATLSLVCDSRSLARSLRRAASSPPPPPLRCAAEFQVGLSRVWVCRSTSTHAALRVV